jgi:hypothetical protein
VQYDNSGREARPYSVIRIVALAAFPFFFIGLYCGMSLKDMATDADLFRLLCFPIGFVLIGTFLWNHLGYQRGYPAWIRLAPMWTGVGGFVIGWTPLLQRMFLD